MSLRRATYKAASAENGRRGPINLNRLLSGIEPFS